VPLDVEHLRLDLYKRRGGIKVERLWGLDSDIPHLAKRGKKRSLAKLGCLPVRFLQDEFGGTLCVPSEGRAKCHSQLFEKTKS